MMKIVIISSFREACGPAAHTIYLKKALENVGVDVEVAKIDVSLMRRTSRAANNLVRKELNRIIKLSNQADGVILQIEPGLYGPAPWISYKRINKLLDRIKVKALTVIHGFDRPSVVYKSLLGIVKDALSPNSTERRYYLSQIMLRFHPSYSGFLKRLSKRPVVCFSKADINELDFFSGDNNNYVPISYLLQEDINRIASGSDRFRKNIIKRLNIDPKDKLIIAPGFINTYKNTIATLNSLQYLSKNYHLIICGGLHPHSSQLNESLFELVKAKNGAKAPMPEYFKNLKLPKFSSSVSPIEEYPKELRDRIHFVGSADDDALNDWIAAADYVVLPYLNTITGQSGSGPFALAIEIGKQSFFGSASVFYAQDYVSSTSPFTFDSTNPSELAYRIQNAERDKKHYDEFISKFRATYTAERQAHKYLELLGRKDA